jgi:hypothetical protein
MALTTGTVHHPMTTVAIARAIVRPIHMATYLIAAIPDAGAVSRKCVRD